MKLLILVGSGAVGKMTVGQSIMRKTALRLFHNHMMIEPVIEIFGEYNHSVVAKLRRTIFEEFLKTEREGLILPICGLLIALRTAITFVPLRSFFAHKAQKSIVQSLLHLNPSGLNETERKTACGIRLPNAI